MTVKDNDKVLEISTGTGDNFRFLNKKAVYYGVDISLGMLKQAKKHVNKWKRDAMLIHCEGEELPFRDNYFDETDKLVRESYQKNPLIKKDFQDADKARVPVDLVPAEMKEISSEIICKGLMYKITFIKP